jgi:O-antigen/teichoic acid export membrane protein
MNAQASSISGLTTEVQNEATRKQIRGSSLLLAGKAISSGINFAAQILLVRYLSTSDYGALAYGLAVVAFLQVFSTLGLQKGIPRFVPIYQESNQHGKLFGTLLLAVVALLVLMLAAAVFMQLGGVRLFGLLTADKQALALLSILIFLVPVQAFDDLLISFFASLTQPRAIFFRKHVLGPALKFGVVLALVAFNTDVIFVAWGYFAASLLGILLYSVLLVKLLWRENVVQHFRLKNMRIPIRELFAFSIPVLTSELVAGGMLNSVAIFLLAHFHGTTEVAFYRVAIPAAHMNMFALASFSLLYTPLAARLYARGDYDGINHLYWRTTVWLTVITFPVFIATFALAKPMAVLLYGTRYEASGLILALLSLGYYFNSALGMNTQTLRVFGEVRYILGVNLLSFLAGVVIISIVIPQYGALGAAIGTSATLVVRNLLTQIGLRLISNLRSFDRQYLATYVLVTISALGLFLIQMLGRLSISAFLPLAAAITLLMFVITRNTLRIAEVFPEIRRLPLMKTIFA